MHRALVIALFASSVVAGSLAIAPDARAAARLSPAKVVIVVGATHGATASYRARADAAYAEARRHTSNVVKVYSPNATWTRVKAAAVGASVLIYFGHGNGWPSPYTYDPQYSTKDGFGLNSDTNGDGRLSDNENRYYGEPYVRTLDLAPNAIVMLHHLCYASGNSEPGHAQPTVTVARQRISNYAAGFLRTNAQAVIADGHRGPADYLRAAVHDRPDDRVAVADRAGQQRPRQVVHLDADQRRARADGSRGDIERVLSLAGHGSAADDHDGDRDRRHEPAPGHDGGPGPGGRRDAGRAPLPGCRDRGGRRARCRVDAARRHAAHGARALDAGRRRRRRPVRGPGHR